MSMRLRLVLTGGILLFPALVRADTSVLLPPYNHYLPPVLTQYANEAEAAGDNSTARVLRARVKRLVGDQPVSATQTTSSAAVNPTVASQTAGVQSPPSLAATSNSPGQPVVPLVISQDKVPPLWTTRP